MSDKKPQGPENLTASQRKNRRRREERAFEREKGQISKDAEDFRLKRARMPKKLRHTQNLLLDRIPMTDKEREALKKAALKVQEQVLGKEDK